MTRKAPREKKQDSYEKDTRNIRGESGARSRFAVSRARRVCASRARAAVRQAAEASLVNEELGERLEGRAVVKFGGRWQKSAHAPLGAVLARRKKGRLHVWSYAVRHGLA